MRKYVSPYEIVLLFPSLIMAEILTFGYSARLGLNGIKFKIKAMWDGINIKINREKGDKLKLYEALNPTIPIDELSYNRLDKAVKILANYVFLWNLRVIK